MRDEVSTEGPPASLHERLLAHGPLPVAEVVAVGVAVADALVSAHGRGLAHGAVTPRNVLVLPTSYALADLAPAGGAAAADDVWALGATLFTLLTGKPPGAGDTRADRVRAEVPAALAEVIAWCLRARPDAAAVRAALTAVDPHGGGAVEPPTVPGLAPVARPAPRRWKGFAVTGLVAAVVGVGIGGLGARDAAPASPPATTASIPPGGDPAVAPVLTSVDRNGESAEVAWTDPTRGQAQFVLYDVTEAGAPPVPLATVDAGRTSHVVTGLDPTAPVLCVQLVAIGLADPATLRGASARVCTTT